MRRKDFLLLAALSVLLAALLAPAGFSVRAAPANFGDLFAYHYPMRHLVVSALEAGRLPFWNPYIFSGLPLAANPQAALFYPVAALGYVLPLTLALSWDFLFHLSWAALGLCLLARRQGLGTLGAFWLAAVFALSPFLVYRVQEGIPTLLASLSWAPWAWLCWLEGGALWLAAAWSLQFLSGHPQFMVVNALAMTAWALTQPRRLDLLGRLFAAGLGTLLLCAAQWLPLREFLAHSVRGGWPRSYALGYSVGWRDLASVVYPDAFGNPLRGTYEGPASVFFETLCLWAGLPALAAAVWGFWRGRSAGALALGLLGLFLAAGGNNPVYAALLEGPLGWLRTPSRYLFLCLWSLLLAAGAGWRRFEAEHSPSGAFKAAVVALAVLELAAWDGRWLSAKDTAPFLVSNPAVAAALGGRPWRVMTDPDLASPNKTMLYRALNVNGYEAFYLGGYPEYASRSEGKAAADASRTYLKRYDTPEMNRLGVRWFLRADGRLVENKAALPLAFFRDAQGRVLPSEASVVMETPERWSVSAVAPKNASAIVAALPDYPGWRATLNGSSVPITKWDGLLQSVALPEGAKAVSLSLDYSPTGWPLPALLSILAWGAWLAAASKKMRGGVS